mmetsp:Transcript_1036/g.3651  ORF Transcript_1036/g.3651 Transcript_1036/m.3651 type:complete len:440 (-) Transcript_1036:1535-2854(-)
MFYEPESVVAVTFSHVDNGGLAVIFDIIPVWNAPRIVHSLFSGDGGRARMWPYLNGQIPVDTSEFESIVAKLNKDESSTSRQVRNQIDKDVRRTPQTSMETCTNKLTRLLYAFASARPEIGYCQGINYLAAVIMTHITNESHILAVLLSVSDILPMYWHPSLEGTRQDTILFQHLLRENLPSLAAHFDSIGIDVNHLVMPWFLCAFTSTLPLEHATALLDLLLVESSRAILFRVALELLRVNEVKLVQNLDGIEVMKEVMNVPTTPPPVQELINGANEYAKAGVTLEGLKKLHLVYSVQTSLPKTASGGDASMNYGLTRKMRSLEDDRRAKEEQVALLNMNLEQTAAALKEKERQLELKDAEISKLVSSLQKSMDHAEALEYKVKFLTQENAALNLRMQGPSSLQTLPRENPFKEPTRSSRFINWDRLTSKFGGQARTQ